ncbi:hypothetical protein PR048_012864 [Dryococelus australis]|uniref:DDE-1 domain-containing protein n=1 Tax=Dryococelus australis TaxID=614101 RepID=A0ABQ9HQI6_9NEOP|nr:hypothetical protein PR048_012864 [Dryococelus australis]
MSHRSCAHCCVCQCQSVSAAYISLCRDLNLGGFVAIRSVFCFFFLCVGLVYCAAETFCLIVADKIRIFEQLDKGVSGKQLADFFLVWEHQQFQTKTNKSSILNFVSVLQNDDGSSSRKELKTAENKELEKAVFKRFLQHCSSFKASNDWLRNLKARHSICELDLSGEKLSADPKAAENNLTTVNFYTTQMRQALFGRFAKKKTLASKRETSAPGHKVSKASVTMLNCANSTGNYNIPFLLIGKLKNPRASKILDDCCFVYRMDNSIFIPEVKKYQKAVGKEGSNVMVNLDNAPTHPTESLDREDGCFKTLFLPPNITSLLQPMDQ